MSYKSSPDKSFKQLQNKIIDGGVASDKSAIYLPANTTAALAENERKVASIAFDTTLQEIVIDKGAGFVSLGGGSGTVTSVGSGTGLSGGPITASGTLSLANTAVTPGSYSAADITVDAQGRITSAANGASGITWATPVDSNITFDTHDTYNIGTASVAPSTVYSGAGGFYTDDGAGINSSLYQGGMGSSNGTSQFWMELYDNTDPDGGNGVFGTLFTDGGGQPSLDIFSTEKLWLRADSNISVIAGNAATIKLQKSGVANNIGDVWTATGVNGEGYWAAAGGAGANTALSNLTVTSINTNLLPDNNAMRNIGSGSLAFSQIFTTQLLSNTGNSLTLGADAGIDMTGTPVVQLPTDVGDPSPLGAGSVYFNTVSGKLKVYNGSAWETITSA